MGTTTHDHALTRSDSSYPSTQTQIKIQTQPTPLGSRLAPVPGVWHGYNDPLASQTEVPRLTSSGLTSPGYPFFGLGHDLPPIKHPAPQDSGHPIREPHHLDPDLTQADPTSNPYQT